MLDYDVTRKREYMNMNDSDSLQLIQDQLWNEFDRKDKEQRTNHTKSDSLRQIEIIEMYNLYPKDSLNTVK